MGFITKLLEKQFKDNL